MAKTQCSISFGLVDVDAKADSSASISDKQPFVNLADLKADFLTVTKYATLEQDQWKADGTFDIMDDSISGGVGLWSLSQSDSAGVFSSPPILTMTFSTQHSSNGITLDFSPYEDFCDDLNVKWYNGVSLLYSVNFTPDSTNYFCSQTVSNFNKIVITFNGTSVPYRYLKLKRIVYGEEIKFTGSEIIQAGVLEEINPISAEISINTLDFQLYSEDARFSIINPTGVFAALQNWQPIQAMENIDGVDRDMGTFYLKSWENVSENVAKLSGVDLVGMIDETYFLGGIYSGVSAGTIISAIMASANAQYTLDASFTGVLLDGWIPYCTHREALQQVCFAIGAVVDGSRSYKINIKPAPSVSSGTITGDRKKMADQKVTLKPLVTGVSVMEHKFNQTTTAVELFNGTLAAGTFTIIFTAPAHTLTITGGAIASSGANHAVLTISTPGTVVLSGKTYEDTTNLITKTMAGLSSADKTNVVKVENAYLVSARNSATTVDRIYAYYQNRLKQEFSLFPGSEAVGILVDVETLYAELKRGTIEKLELDLTGGYIGKAVVVGA